MQTLPGTHRWPAALLLGLALLSGCSVTPASIPLVDSAVVVRRQAAAPGFHMQPLAFAAGKAQGKVESWREPVLLVFGGGVPDKEFPFTLSASTQADNTAADGPAVVTPAMPHRLAERRRHRRQPSIQAGHKLKSVPATPATVGEQRSFWVDTDQPAPNRFVSHAFRLEQATPHGYIWVDEQDRTIIDHELVAELAKYWEEVAYPRAIATFGDVPRGAEDVDQDDHIYIMLTSTTGNASAFFEPVDMMPDGDDETRHCNWHKDLWIGQKWWEKGKATREALFATAIHEFQHLINFSQKGYLPAKRGQQPLSEEAWLDEGLAVYAEQVGGFGLASGSEGMVEDVAHFLEQDPGHPIVTSGDSDAVDYAAGYLFATYLADRYGPEAIRTLVAQAAIGTKGVEIIASQPFATIFGAWGVSLYASGLTDDPRFSFRSFNLRRAYGGHQFRGVVPPLSASRYPWRRQGQGKSWSLQFAAFAGTDGPLTVGVQAGKAALPTALLLGQSPG